MSLKTILIGAVALGTAVMHSSANAAVTITFEEVGSDVVATTTGSINLEGMTYGGIDDFIRGVAPGQGAFGTDGVILSADDWYTGNIVGSPFGAGVGVIAGSQFSGDSFFIIGASDFTSDQIAFGQGYISGQDIFATTTWLNRTFNSLGLVAGTYVYTLPNDTVTFQIGSAVPEPATWAMFLLGFGAMGYSMRRRNRTVTKVSFA